MRPDRMWSCALILLGLATLIPSSMAPSYFPGVEPGDWARYGDIFTSWESNIPGLPPPDPIVMFQGVDSTILSITGVSDSTITASQTFNYANGTSKATTLRGSVRDGTGNLTFWILSSGLSTGDPIYEGVGAPAINYTTTRAFAGAVREAAVLNLTVSFGATGYASVVGFWDRPTGILLNIAFEVFYNFGGQTASGRSVATLTETNLWSAGEPSFTIIANPPFLVVNKPLNGTVVALTTITLNSVGNFSGSVFIGIGIFPNLVNGPTAVIDVPNVTLSPGGSVSSLLNVFVTSETAGGAYTLNVTATDFVQSRTVLIPLTVNPVSQPDFTITAIPNPTPLPAGIANFTAIILTSINGFSGTMQLTAELAYSNVTGQGFISFQLEPTNLTLAPYQAATSLLSLFVTANSTGTFGVRVTATSDSLTHETIVDIIIFSRPIPVNHPPVAVISFSPPDPAVGTLVSFNGFGSFDPDGFITSYQWSFGDGTMGFGPSTSHAYFAPGTYNVTLTVADNLGAEGTSSVALQVRQQPAHDVAVVSIQVNPNLVVVGQAVDVFVILQNKGPRNETVSLTVFADSHILASRSNILLNPSDPFGGFVFLRGNTTGLAPGSYVVSATVFLLIDENPSDNTLVDGPLTVLPPPVINVTPNSGTLGTTVTVHGTGFPQPTPGFVSPPILVSFDDMFMGFTIPTNGLFEFVFSIPHAEPGIHLIKALDTFSGVQVSTPFTVLQSTQPASELSVSVDVGAVYFPGETAVIHVLTNLNGVPAQPPGLQVQAMLHKPDGSTQQLNLISLGNGLYKAEYAVPRSGSLGTYVVVVTATHGESSSSEMAVFEVKPTWLSSQGPRIASATIAVGGILAVVGLAWRKGYFRKNSEDHLEATPPEQTS